MNAPVDVLAVMDAAAGHVRTFGSFAQDTGAFRANNAQAGRLASACAAALAVIEARAAVADALEALRNSPCYCEDGTDGEQDITCDRCRALARCGGAK